MSLEALTWSWPGAVLGAVVGVGLLLVLRGIPAGRRPDLADRVGPYVSDKPRPSRLLQPTADLSVHRLLRPVLGRLGALVDHLLGGATSVRRRLERAGQPTDVEGFRAQQGPVGSARRPGRHRLRDHAGAALGHVDPGGRAAHPAVRHGRRGGQGPEADPRRASPRGAHSRRVPFCRRDARARDHRGRGRGGRPLERVTKLSRGELSGELGRCLADARAGASLPEALQGLADRTGIPSLARFVDGIVVAVERGTPLADVMRAQAQDARDAGKQLLLEEGGRREIAMMVPVVFLVLPVTILFARLPRPVRPPARRPLMSETACHLTRFVNRHQRRRTP